MNIIATESLTKVYRSGRKEAVSDLNLKVSGGELFGFLGPNGAGKTTTIRILMTLLRPTRGRARVAGYDIAAHPMEALKRVGYVPENPGFYPTLTGCQHLRYYARLYGLGRSRTDKQLEELLQRVGLTDAADARAKTYSLGMKRRLAIAGALVPDPELMILDEPSLGLDPEGMAFVRSLLKDFHDEGRTVFLSSHLLAEVEKLCTQVGVLQRGKLLRLDTPQALVQAMKNQGSVFEVETRGVNEQVCSTLGQMQGISGIEVQGTTLRMRGLIDDDLVADIVRTLVASGVDVLSSRRPERDLEQAFLELTRPSK